MKINILCLSILIVGCGQQQQSGDPRTIHGIDPAFTQYVQEFEAYIPGGNIGDIPIGFAAQSGQVIGVCEIWTSGYRDIKVDPTFWNGTSDEYTRRSLIFHELGHCVLDRAHLATTTLVNPSLPYNFLTNPTIYVSFMNPYIFFDGSQSSLQDYYINELFHPAIGVPMLYNSSNLVDDHACVRHMN